MSEAIVKFYQKVREDEAMFTELRKCTTEAEIVDLAIELAAKNDIVISADEARANASQFENIISQAANDDELNDFELELIAAGAPINCYSDTQNIHT